MELREQKLVVLLVEKKGGGSESGSLGKYTYVSN
jgi:hypothetical protein